MELREKEIIKNIKGKIKKTGEIVKYFNYDLGVPVGNKMYDFKDENGKYWKYREIMGSLPVLEEVIIGRQKNKSIHDLDKAALYKYLYNKSINIKRNIGDLTDIYMCNVLQYVDINGDIIPPKMFTITFKSDITDLETAERRMKGTVKRLEYLVRTKIDPNFKLSAIGVKEKHTKIRKGYHFHFICFNLPKIDFSDFSSFGVKESNKYGRIEISVLKQFKNKIIDVKNDGKEEKVNFINDPVIYISKTISYMQKELEDLYKIDYSIDITKDKELIVKLEKELNKSVLYKIGKLIKPEVLNLYSDDEFKMELDKAFDMYSFQEKIEFNTEFLGWVDVFKFFDMREKSEFLEQVMDYIGFDFEYIGEKDVMPVIVNYNKNKFFIDYKNNKLMYVDNDNFDIVIKEKYGYILKKVNNLSGEIKDFIEKNKK